MPEQAILREDKARHTFENAELTLAVLKEHNIPFKKVILVCKAYHSRRALLIYQYVFPNDVEFFVSPVMDKRGIARDNWFQDKEKIKLVMNEVEKIGAYFGNKIEKCL